jgi:hypothetical protein
VDSSINKYMSDINIKPIVITNIPKAKGFTGRRHSEETKRKISKAKKGVPNMKNRKLDEVQIRRLKKDKANGDTITMLSNRYKLSRKTIYTYLYGDKN